MTNAMTLYAKPGHKSVSRGVGCALTRGTADAWLGLVTVLRGRLSDDERAALAFAALKPLGDDTALLTIEAACKGLGLPLLPGADVEGDARWWAARAMPAERDAYCVAAFETMPSDRQAEFLGYGRQMLKAAA